MFNSASVTVTSGGKPVTIHMVSTGAVAVKTRFKKSRFQGLLAMADFILDNKFTEWLPIWVMIVEHPEGVFVIDAGEITAVNTPGYFKSSGFMADWFDTTQFRFQIKPEEEIDKQLQALNIPVEKVKSLILTHLHFDHTDGVKHFPSTPILVSRDEWAKPFGDLPKLYPAWFKPTLVDLTEQYDVFKKAYCITQAKDMWLVETPGHTYHHCSVLLKMDGINILFAADICYNLQQLMEESYPGNNAGNKLAKQTYDTVKAFAQQHPTVFIPSHDAGTVTRLQQFSVI